MSELELSILLVEDNLADAELLSEMLQMMDRVSFSLQRVASLHEAHESLARQHFTLLFLDLSLPDSFGLDTLASIRAQDQSTPVIVLTGVEDSETKLFAARMKANGYLVKGNFDTDTLFRLIREAAAPVGAPEDSGASEDSLELIVARDSQNADSAHPDFDRERIIHRAVEKERALLAAAVSSADDPIIITDRNSVILYVNPAFSRVTGFTQQEALGINASLLGSGEHDSDFFCRMYESLRAKNTWNGQLLNRRKNGELLRMDATITSVRDARGNVENYVMVSRDVTEFVELQRQLNKSMRLNAIGQLAGGIAHEFNNVLQVIISYGAVLSEETKVDQPRLNRYATGIVDAAKRAANLTRQLLVFSRGQTLQVERLDLNAIVEAAVRLLDPLIGEDISIVRDLSPTLPLVEVDASQIEEIITNLCVNAREAIVGGGEIRIVTERISLEGEFCNSNPWAVEGDYLRLTVTDSGSGMSPEVMEHMFEPFFTTKGEGKAAGMGLASVYGIVKQQKGLIHCESTVGDRTTFQIYFPVASEQEAAREEPVRTPVVKQADGTIRVLVAEDDPLIAALSGTLLEGAGYLVTIVSDGHAAFQELVAATEPYALVLSDVVMPKTGGIELMSLVKDSPKISPKPIFLLSTGYNPGALEARISADICYEYLQKPFSPADLLMMVRKMLRDT